jgi:Acetyltransferase (GNAT) domain
MTGYLSPGYAQSLAEFGNPRELPRSGGWVLEREIPGFPFKDAMGCYPIFACRDWSQLHADLADLEDIGTDLVSLSLVTDPFGEYTPTYLRQCFNDVAIPFKEHFIVDLRLNINASVSSHHRRYARKALQKLEVEKPEDPARYLDQWRYLYTALIERHQIKGIPAFSPTSFARQMDIPGIVAFRAVYQGRTIGMLLWYVQGDVGYYHLGAYNSLGYEMRASFALFWSAIEHFAAIGLRWLNLGARAGVNSSESDGLTRFKGGWATGTRMAYFCGRIFNRTSYLEIVSGMDISPNGYFPAYRDGEFG